MCEIISLRVTGKSIVITAWKKDSPFHDDMEAFDIRMWCYIDEELTDSEGPNHYLKVDAFQEAMWDDGIPACPIRRGKRGMHWHVGDLATLVALRRNPPETTDA